MDRTKKNITTKYYIMIILFVVIFIMLALWPFIVVSIMPGHSGVHYSQLFGGTDMDRIYNEGAHFIAPWDRMYVFDTRVQEKTSTFHVLSKDGLTIEVEASIRYQVIPERLPELQTKIGPEYERIIIIPTFTSAIREAVGRYRPEELYTSARQAIQDNALIEALSEVSRMPILINSIVIKRIGLPDKINKSIENKLSEEQENLRYEYLLQTTYQEVKRKALEAEGIRLYQKAINEGLTERLLRFEGIQATKELAASKNSKMVIVGGKNGLPLILNPDTPNEELTTSDIEPKRNKQYQEGSESFNDMIPFGKIIEDVERIWNKTKASEIPKKYTEDSRK